MMNRINFTFLNELTEIAHLLNNYSNDMNQVHYYKITMIIQAVEHIFVLKCGP
jgi:uncharacterized protein with HEPN domain